MADANYWDNAAFGTTSPAETAEKPLSMWDKLFGGAINSLATLPKRAIDASTQDVQHLGEPDYQRQSIAPAVETAMTMTGGAGVVPAEANSLRMGIKAYHGSPHDFEKFDLSKIGTGEGAQAYGHGLYFAENPATAQAYRETLSGNKGLDAHDLMTNMLQSHKGDYAAAARELQGRIDSVQQIPEKYRADISKTNLPEAIRMLQENAAPKGRMYEVNINADPAHFLDWNKPLSEQSGHINDKLKNVFDSSLQGREAYQSLIKDRAGGGMTSSGIKLGATPEAASGRFNATGIPGIKYLDQGSRGSGQGSSNYVVFNDKLIDIIKKYGLAGIAPPAAAMSYDNLMRNNQ